MMDETTIDCIARRADMPEAVGAIKGLMSADGGDGQYDAGIVFDVVASIDASEEGWSGPGMRHARVELLSLCRGQVPDTWNRVRSSSDLNWLDRPVVQKTTPNEPRNSPTRTTACERTEPAKHWRKLAAPYLTFLKLSEAEQDVLNTAQRVIVDRKGWGLADQAKDDQLALTLVPELLTRRGKRCPVNSHKKAIPRLQRLGLLAHVGQAPNGRKLLAPTWDPRISPEPEAVFKRASDRIEDGADKAIYWRATDTRKAQDPVRSIDQEAVCAIRAYASERSAFLTDSDSDKNHNYK